MEQNDKDVEFITEYEELIKEDEYSERVVEDDKEHSFGKITKELGSFLKEILITIVIVFFVISFIAQPTTVDGFSMNPTLDDQNQLIIEKVSQRFSGFSRYDIVVFPFLEEENKYFIKRIIGMPGESVDIIDGSVYINNVLLEEPFLLDKIMDYGTNEFPITIPEGEYFVLGDNRNHSKDSRYSVVGLVNGDDILGKGFIRLWPLKDFGFIQ